MKLVENVPPVTGEYPHVIVKIGPRYSWHERVAVTVGAAETVVAHVRSRLSHPCPFGPAKKLCDDARQLLVEATKVYSRRMEFHACVVWAADHCTFIAPCGETHDGDVPPTGTLQVAEDSFETSPITLEPCFSYRLPDHRDGRERYLCVKRTGDLVEIMLGEYIVLGSMAGEPVQDGTGTPDSRTKVATLTRNPTRHRGQPVTHADDGVLFGPPQPVQGGKAIVLHDPWRHEVVEACKGMTGSAPPPELVDALWNKIRLKRTAMKEAA